MVVSKLWREMCLIGPPVWFTAAVYTADHTGFSANNTISSTQEKAFNVCTTVGG